MPINSSEIKPHFYKSCWSCGTSSAASRNKERLTTQLPRRFSIAFAWVTVFALEPLVPSCAAPRLPVAEPVYSADAVYDQVRESTVLAVENAKHAVGMA